MMKSRLTQMVASKKTLPQKYYKELLYDLKATFGINEKFMQRFDDISLPLRMKIFRNYFNTVQESFKEGDVSKQSQLNRI